jgi:transposase
VFDFRLVRDRARPKYFLQDFHGLLQTDGYAAYDKVGASGMVHAACWAHCRRGFAQVVKLNPNDPARLRSWSGSMSCSRWMRKHVSRD